MKNTISALLSGVLLALICSSTAFAQGSPPWRIVPVDLWTCSFNDRQDMGDLDSWVARFNGWADEQEDDDYAAWTLTSSYWGTNQTEWDFIWLGVWKDANAMGQGWDNWNATNEGLMAQFTEISSCGNHVNFASAAYRLPRDQGTPQSAILTVSDCKLKHGIPFAALDRATRQWTRVLDDSGSGAAIYHWYPVYGGGGEEFDFKLVYAYENYSELGADYERMGNGRLFEQSQALFDHLVDCDSSRVYDARNRRWVDVRAD